jgi:hypothetical protein
VNFQAKRCDVGPFPTSAARAPLRHKANVICASCLLSFRFQLNLVQRLIFPREGQWRLGCSASDILEVGKFAVLTTVSAVNVFPALKGRGFLQRGPDKFHLGMIKYERDWCNGTGKSRHPTYDFYAGGGPRSARQNPEEG